MAVNKDRKTDYSPRNTFPKIYYVLIEIHIYLVELYSRKQSHFKSDRYLYFYTLIFCNSTGQNSYKKMCCLFEGFSRWNFPVLLIAKKY